MTPEERKEMGEKGRAHVEANYNFEKFGQQWVEHMLGVHEKHGSWAERKKRNLF